MPPPTETVVDAGVDAAIKKGVRCCVECGATSTPQWREGPLGPKTLCNACGVRRQRQIRKQQQAAAAAQAEALPAAPSPSNRRISARQAAQAPPPVDAHEHGAGSLSDQGSDETDQYGDWAAHGPHANPSSRRTRQQPQQPQPPNTQEEETAAYDLLFFAGVDPGPPTDAEEPNDNGDFGDGDYGQGVNGSWRSRERGGHGHNTRRQSAPQRRSDDFYYYEDEPEPEAHVTAGGVRAAAGGAAANKRRRAAPPPPPRVVRIRALPGSSTSSSEDPPLGSAPLIAALNIPDSSPDPAAPAPAAWSPRRVPTGPAIGRTAAAAAQPQDVEDLLAYEKPLERLPTPTPPERRPPARIAPIAAAAADRATDAVAAADDAGAVPALGGGAVAGALNPLHALQFQLAYGLHPSPYTLQNLGLAYTVAADVPTNPLPVAANIVPLLQNPASMSALLPASVHSLTSLQLLQLQHQLQQQQQLQQLQIASVSPQEVEVLVRMRAFQESCRQLQRAEAACDAVGGVVAEHAAAAARAHEAAAAASQQLAAEARSVSERYGGRDLLTELRERAAAAPAAGAGAAAAAPQ